MWLVRLTKPRNDRRRCSSRRSRCRPSPDRPRVPPQPVGCVRRSDTHPFGRAEPHGMVGIAPIDGVTPSVCTRPARHPAAARRRPRHDPSVSAGVEIVCGAPTIDREEPD